MQLVYILLAVETQSHYVIACLLACLAGSPPLSLGIEIKMIYLSLIVFAIQESLFLSLSLSRECNNWYLNREHMRFALRFSRKMIYFKKKKVYFFSSSDMSRRTTNRGTSSHFHSKHLSVNWRSLWESWIITTRKVVEAAW